MNRTEALHDLARRLQGGAALATAAACGRDSHQRPLALDGLLAALPGDLRECTRLAELLADGQPPDCACKLACKHGVNTCQQP